MLADGVMVLVGELDKEVECMLMETAPNEPWVMFGWLNGDLYQMRVPYSWDMEYSLTYANPAIGVEDPMCPARHFKCLAWIKRGMEKPPFGLAYYIWPGREKKFREWQKAHFDTHKQRADFLFRLKNLARRQAHDNMAGNGDHK